MKCPVCQQPDLVMSERAGVEVDYCPQCRGIWLDRGELDKILDRAAREQPTAPPPPPAPAPPPPPAAMPPYKSQPNYPPRRDDSRDDSRDYSHREYHGGRRKKSWWMEIFD